MKLTMIMGAAAVAMSLVSPAVAEPKLLFPSGSFAGEAFAESYSNGSSSSSSFGGTANNSMHNDSGAVQQSRARVTWQNTGNPPKLGDSGSGVQGFDVDTFSHGSNWSSAVGAGNGTGGSSAERSGYGFAGGAFSGSTGWPVF